MLTVLCERVCQLVNKQLYNYYRQLTLTKGAIPSKSSVTGTVKTSHHIRTRGTLMTVVYPSITLVYICTTRQKWRSEILGWLIDILSLKLYSVSNQYFVLYEAIGWKLTTT